MEDRKIIELYFARDERAIRETDEKYGRLCFSIAKDILESRQDAEECVNDTYLGLWNSIPPERPENLTAYIGKITRNLGLKRLRFNSAQKRSEGLRLSFCELEEILPDSSYAPGRLEHEDVGRLISRFLKTRPESERRVFLRKYWFFDSVADISAMFGFSESKVKSMLFHTRKKLREYLEKEGVSL